MAKCNKSVGYKMWQRKVNNELWQGIQCTRELQVSYQVTKYLNYEF